MGVLSHITLGYQLLWGPLRRLRGVQLCVAHHNTAALSAAHLLGALESAWTAQAPTLILCPLQENLLAALLEHAPRSATWVEVDQLWLDDPAMAQRVHQAHQRGLKLMWRGAPGERPSAPLMPCFEHLKINLTAQEALNALRVSLRKHHGSTDLVARPVTSPVLANQVLEALPSRVLVEHALDQQGAWGVVGWPMEDVLHGYRHRHLQPQRDSILCLVRAIDADESLDGIEQLLADEPLLSYRFLRYTNSAAVGLANAVPNLRHGLMIMGCSMLRAWLLEQLPAASSDMNLQPVRQTMVLRAELMARLLDAGDSDELRSEVLLCGVLSQIDLLLGEPLAVSLQRLPLSERVSTALLDQSGPYAPYLALAAALESSDTAHIEQLCQAHGMDQEAVNGALLRVLADTHRRWRKDPLLV